MAIYDDTRTLAFNFTDMEEVQIPGKDSACFTDVLFYCGKLYGVNARGIVFVCDLDGLKMMPISNKITCQFQ